MLNHQDIIWLKSYRYIKKNPKNWSCLTAYFLIILLLLVRGKTTLLNIYQSSSSGRGFPPWEMLMVGLGTGFRSLGWAPRSELELELAEGAAALATPVPLSLQGAAGFQHKLESKRWWKEPPYMLLHGPDSWAAAAVWAHFQTAIPVLHSSHLLSWIAKGRRG